MARWKAVSDLKIDIRPEVAALRMFSAMKYTPWFALGEFVDNAITSAQQNVDRLREHDPEYRLVIDLRFDDEAGVIEVSDNAAGISKADLPRALRTASPPADKRFLSIYGVGMKAAGLWWAQTLTIDTKAFGERTRRTIVIDTRELDRPGRNAVQVAETPASPREHGTTIRLSNLTKKVPEGRTLGKIRSYLASMYRHFLNNGLAVIRVGGEKLSWAYPPFLHQPYWPTSVGPEEGSQSRTWRKDVAVTLKDGRQITGWVGLLAKGSTVGAGFLLTFHGKAIVGVGAGTGEGEELYRPAEIFGKGNTYRRQRLVGEFDVSVFGKSITSDSVNWEDEEEREFLVLLKRKLTAKSGDYLSMAENYRVKGEGGGGAVLGAKQAAEGAVRALERTAHEAAVLLGSPAPETQPGPKSVVVGTARSSRMTLPVPGGTKVVAVRLSVEQAGQADWLSLYKDSDELVVRVNEEHPFMLSFAQLPVQQIEPVLRLALGLGVAEFVDPDHVRTRLNALLRGPLSSRSEMEEISD